jgi:hypothetical protein
VRPGYAGDQADTDEEHPMRYCKIINGLLYDTETADLICDITPKEAGQSRSDFNYDDTGLYRTPGKRFFIAGEGGPTSRWSTPVNNGLFEGNGLREITEEEAKAFVEEFASVEMYIAVFGEPDSA